MRAVRKRKRITSAPSSSANKIPWLSMLFKFYLVREATSRGN